MLLFVHNRSYQLSTCLARSDRRGVGLSAGAAAGLKRLARRIGSPNRPPAALSPTSTWTSTRSLLWSAYVRRLTTGWRSS